MVAQMYYRKHSNNFVEGLRFYSDPGYHVNWECYWSLEASFMEVYQHYVYWGRFSQHYFVSISDQGTPTSK